MRETADISVVIPLFNKAPRIEACLKSVLSQTVLPREIIVVDDGSTDNGAEHVQKIANTNPGFIFLVRQLNSGVSSARNNGIMRASAPLVALLDADDLWAPFFIEKANALMTDFPDSELYCLGHDVNDTAIGHFGPPQSCPPGFRGYLEDFFKASKRGSIANSSKVVIRKSAIRAIGGFPVGVKVGEDLFVWMQLAIRGPVAYDSSICATIFQEVDESRHARSGSIPYPLVYFSKDNRRVQLTYSAVSYLWRIHLNHIAGSIMASNKQELVGRLKTGFQLFGWRNIIPCFLALVPPQLLRALRVYRRRKRLNSLR